MLDKLSHGTPDPQYPPHETADSLANSFMMFFENTIAAIRTDLDESCQHVNTNFPDVSLSS